MLRERDSDRLRASLRGAIPAAATVVVLQAGFVVQGLVLGAVAGESGLVRGGLGVSLNVAAYAVSIVAALWIASRLDRRAYADYGLDVDRAWLRDLVAGVVLGGAAALASVWYAEARGIAAVEVTAEASTLEEALALAGAVLLVAGVVVSANAFEEVVYRGIVLQNFAEGLVARGLRPPGAVVAATAGSLLLFVVFHLLRGPLVAIDAGLIGVTFALAYLLTGRLGLAIGVHFGRLPIGLLVQGSELGVEVATIDYPMALAPYLEFTLLQIALVAALVVAWVAHTRGEVRIAEAVYEPARDSADG